MDVVGEEQQHDSEEEKTYGMRKNDRRVICILIVGTLSTMAYTILIYNTSHPISLLCYTTTSAATPHVHHPHHSPLLYKKNNLILYCE